jgi:hypothetical protein
LLVSFFRSGTHERGGAEEVEVSQKAGGTDARGVTTSEAACKEQRPPSEAPSSPVRESDPAAHALSAALKGFVATLHKQAERNSDVVDVFARALKDLNREVRDERMRREILERRLRETEGRIEELSRVVAALARQSWVH